MDPDLDAAVLFHWQSSYSELVRPDGAPSDRPEPGGAGPTTDPGTRHVALPGRAPELDAALGDVLAARRTVRQFSAAPLEMATLGRLLRASAGVEDRPDPLPDEPVERRASPSAGACYPVEVQVATRRVRDVPDGLYHYDPRRHRLAERFLGDACGAVTAATVGPANLGGANAVVVLVGVPARSMSKYGARGYRFMLLDAGHLAQNVCLVAAALGLGAYPVGGFFDRTLHHVLGLADGELPLLAIGIGHPAGSPGPQ